MNRVVTFKHFSREEILVGVCLYACMVEVGDADQRCSTLNLQQPARRGQAAQVACPTGHSGNKATYT